MWRDSQYRRLSTVTIRRDGCDLTVCFVQRGGKWFLDQVLDENGREVFLTDSELQQALHLVVAGVDETGV